VCGPGRGRRLRATRFLVRTNLAIIGQTIVGRGGAGWRSNREEQTGYLPSRTPSPPRDRHGSFT